MEIPQKFIVQVGKLFPDLWRAADAMRQTCKEAGIEYDSSVFLPYAGWYEITRLSFKVERLGPIECTLMNDMAFAASWRPSQDIVRFDPDVLEALLDTPLEGKIPTDVLLTLPAWCIYFDVPLQVFGVQCNGFFAMLEEDMESGCFELRLMFLAESDGNIASRFFPLHVGDWDLEEAIKRTDAEAQKRAKELGMSVDSSWIEANREALRKAISCVLYACTYGLLVDKQNYTRGYHPEPKKTKQGWRLFPPDQPRIHILGSEFGQQIRAAMESGSQENTHAGPRPHIRRGHWHGYWTGPRKGERKFGLKWLPPLAVAMREED